LVKAVDISHCSGLDARAHARRTLAGDQPALQVAKEQTRALLAELGFKPIEDITLFADKWFLVFTK
jgi:hypothetical protein